MARNRVIYQSEALFVNQEASLTGGYNQLERVQSANYSFTINRQDVNQYGQLGKLDSIIIDAPSVTADLSYYLTDGFNERALGFFCAKDGESTTAGGFVSGLLADGSGVNLIILTTPEGTDADLPARAAGANDSTIGIGNAYVSDYSVEMAVGSLPTVSVSFDALNINSDSDAAAITSPAILQDAGTVIGGNDVKLPDTITGSGDVAALRPGNVTVDISSFDGVPVADIGTDINGAHIQSASLSVPLSRSTLERLGSNSAYARSVDFPVVATLSVSAIMNEVEASNLVDVIADEVEKTITLKLLEEAGGETGVIYTLKGCSLDSESISSSIGSNKTVDLTFSTSVGGPNDSSHGVFMSGASTHPLNAT
jgi:hypothetical protein